MPEWLDLELSETLRPTVAPRELWSRLEVTPMPKRQSPRVWTAWPVAAMVTIAIAAGTLWIGQGRHAAPARAVQYSDGTCGLCHTSL
jgi:hypothetical protein